MEIEQLKAEFNNKILKDIIASNKYLTPELIFRPIDKKLYLFCKVHNEFVDVDHVLPEEKFDKWCYAKIRYLLHVYPDYDFWTEVSGYPNYLVSTEGQVWSKYTNKLLSTGNSERIKEQDLYIQVTLLGDKISLHKIVLKSFLPDGFNDFEITNHINGIKQHPRLLNLEPSDRSHNTIHSQENLGNYVQTKRIHFAIDGSIDEEIVYSNVANAEKANGLKDKSLHYYINNNKQIQINGKVYLFTRDKPIRKRQLLEEMTDEEFNEEFKEIKEPIIMKELDGNLIQIQYEGYYISKYNGTVVTINQNKKEIVKTFIHNGYLSVKLTGKNDPKKFHVIKISRLVLFVFGEKNYIEENGVKIYYWDLVADHINHDITDNCIDNLQWITRQYNTIRSMEFTPIKIINNLYKTSTVLPSSKILAIFCGLKTAHDIFMHARGKGRQENYLGNNIEYITKEQYHQEKINNNPIILFSEFSSVVEKYNKETKQLIQIYDSIRQAGRSIGKEHFIQNIIRTKSEKENAKNYIYNHKGRLFNTHLKYYEIIYDDYFWRIIRGSIKIFDEQEINEACVQFEKDYVKMSEEYL